ncbi:MAG: GNAT family N-acetyltransferase [Cyanobacteria bacterium P01_H01_bin.152]
MRLPIQLIRGEDNRLVDAVLTNLAETHLSDFDTLWKPMLRQVAAEDKFWDWVVKKRISISSDNFESYAIEYERVAQGLITLETQWHRSWIDRSQRLVYVEALSSAPWNRVLIQQPPTFRGVGTLLLNFARQRSLQLGYGGRIGLHSLPGARRFYDMKNVMEFGSDPDKDDFSLF